MSRIFLAALVACFLVGLCGCSCLGGGPAQSPRPSLKFDPFAVLDLNWETRGQTVRPAAAWQTPTYSAPQFAPQYAPTAPGCP